MSIFRKSGGGDVRLIRRIRGLLFIPEYKPWGAYEGCYLYPSISPVYMNIRLIRRIRGLLIMPEYKLGLYEHHLFSAMGL